MRPQHFSALLIVCGLLAAIPALSSVSIDREQVGLIFGTPARTDDADPAIIALGRSLFHDPRLSSTGTIACASCHDLAAGGDDDRPRSIGVSGQPTGRNSPTVYNLVGHVAYFWDGRAPSLSDQMDGPIHHPDEMGSNWPTIVERLRADSDFRMKFERALDSAITEASLKRAIIAFERSLITDDSPFDDYLRGDEAALTPAQRTGLRYFVDLGCASCHQGPLFGANLFQRLGVFEAYAPAGDPQQLFKVPSLRNVTQTAPYLHDGSIATLREMVMLMGRHQLGYELSTDEADAILAFLDALTSRRFTEPNRARRTGP